MTNYKTSHLTPLQDKKCERCGGDGGEKGLSRHHIIPRRLWRGRSNWRLWEMHIVILCRWPCHDLADRLQNELVTRYHIDRDNFQEHEEKFWKLYMIFLKAGRVNP